MIVGFQGGLITKNKKAEELLSNLTGLLREGTISSAERAAFLVAERQLQRQEYFPKVVKGLMTKLTPLATKQRLTKEGNKLYLKLLEYSEKGFGDVLSAAWGNPFS